MSNDYQTYGDFSADGREFIIRRPDTPRPWLNYAWNEQILISIDQRGRGNSLYRNAAGQRSVPLRDRFVYIKDRDTGCFWTIGWGPVKKDFQHYVCHHGLGYSTLENNTDGILCEWTLTAAAEQPAEVWKIKIVNNSGRERRLSIYPAIEFELGGWVPYGSLENYTSCSYNAPKQLLAVNHSNERQETRNHAVFAASKTPDHYETRRREFLGGYYFDLEELQSVKANNLTDTDADNEEFIGAFQYDITLQPEENLQEYFAVGPWDKPAEADEIAANATEAGFNRGMELAKNRTNDFSRVDFKLPDQNWTQLFNLWTKQQLFLLKDYARVFLIGFRDTLQDAQSLCAYSPEIVKNSMRTTLVHQYRDGSAMRGWCPDDDHKYGDSGVWLPFTVAEYLRETGDREFLYEKVPYRDGGDATVWKHTLQAMDWFFANLGDHGLPKLYFGDWNDSLNIGRGGKGESVWLAMALLAALQETIGIARQLEENQTAEIMSDRAQTLRYMIEKYTWNGKWYLRGFNDAGGPVGSHEDNRIFSEPQSWAFIAGLTPERLKKVVEAVNTRLRTPTGLVVCDPPYMQYDHACGRISCMRPGWGENASCYCHVTAFQAVADCLRRDGDAALDSLTSIVPFNPALSVETSWLEPYALTNMFRGPSNHRPGMTFKGWTSGTVPWALRCMTHFILGVRPEYDGLIIDPVLPSSWDHATITRNFRGVEFRITIRNSEHLSGPQTICRLTVDGKSYAGNKLYCHDFSQGHYNVTATMESTEE